MNKRPGHVNVTTEVAMCSFCGRPRTLRHEEHVLGSLVRTIVTCETCHRTLSSTIGVAAEPTPAEAPAEVAAPTPEEEPAKRAPAKRATAAKKPAAEKPKATARRTTAPKK